MPKTDKEFPISFSDFFHLCKRRKNSIIACMAVFGIIAFLYAITRPVLFEAEGTFHEKGNSSPIITSNITEFLLGASLKNNSESITVMQSRTLIEELVEEKGLQADLKREEWELSKLNNFLLHLKSEYAYWTNNRIPFWQDRRDKLKVREVRYSKEIPRSLEIRFIDDNSYEVYDPVDQTLHKGHMGFPFIHKDYTFTLIRNLEGQNPAQKYTLTLNPLHIVVKDIKDRLDVDVDSEDKNIVRIKYKHPDRFEASQFINDLMVTFQIHQRKEHDRISDTQLFYLENRQNEIEQNLLQAMNKHARSLKDDLSTSGYIGTHKEIDFLAMSLMNCKQKLMDIDLEVKRLNNVVQGSECVYYDQYTGRGDPSVINDILGKIRDLERQKDALQISLQTSSDGQAKEDLFASHLHQLAHVQKASHEASLLLKHLEKGERAFPPLKALKDPHFMVNLWLSKLQTEKDSGVEKQFLHYLNNLIRLLNVQETTLQDRLTHQQIPSDEFQGIDLATSNQLYITYSTELSKVQAEERQYEFILGQLKDPQFEVSSLSSALHDPVSTERIAKASHLLVSLKDENNRSQKEQQRLKEDLALEKDFLAMHLKQTAQLLSLRETLLKEKIQALQGATLDLIHQQISILQKHLENYISSRLENLKQEKSLLQIHVDDLNKKMSALPEKWVAERLLEQRVDMNQKMVEELTKIVESKNIANNLELIQSAPIDFAEPPIHPKNPRLIIFTLLGSLFGGLLAFVIILLHSIKEGIPATPENLRLSHQIVAGPLHALDHRPIQDSDLETLRRIIAHMDQTLLLLTPQDHDFSSALTELLQKQNKRTLRLLLHFNSPSKGGLLEYLEGKIDFPKIHDHIIEGGGISRYAVERLLTERFAQLLDRLRQDYDRIIAVSDAKATSMEAEGLAKLFETVCIGIKNETVQQIMPYFDKGSIFVFLK